MSHSTVHVNTGGTMHEKAHTSLLGQLRDQTVKTDGTSIIDLVDSINTAMGTGTPSEMKARTDIADGLTDEFLLCDSDGHLQIDVLSSALPSGAATESTLASVDGKITACDTGAVVVSSSALPSGAASESTLSTLDAKVTACDTSDVTVTTCALPSGASTESTLSTLDSKITQGYDQTIATGGDGLQQVAIYGQNGSGAFHVINTDTSGHLKTTQQDREIQRSTDTITNDFSGASLSGSIVSSGKTEYWDAQSFDKFQLIVITTSSDALEIQQSDSTVDGDFVTIKTAYAFDGQIVDSVDPAFGRYYRLLNSNGTSFPFTSIKVHYVK